jgi:NAD(P)H-dependent FMN reductase
MATSPKILAFCGSSRRESLNQKFLNAAVEAVKAAGGEVTAISLRDYEMPLYHGDLEDEKGLPENAGRLIALIESHAGLLIASPEYNSMNTPLLKNTLDWCTRADDDPFAHRVAAVISASPGQYGGIRSLKLAQQLLLHLGCLIVPAQPALPQANKAFDAEGRLTNERAQKALQEMAAKLVELARKVV